VALIVVLVALSFASISYSIYSTYKLLYAQDYHLDMQRAHHVTVQATVPEKLALESAFLKSIRSCLPSIQDCVDVNTTTPHHEVAILAPPGEFSSWLHHWASDAIQNELIGSKVHMHLNLISHLPPEGNVQYHKLIRILPSSLLLGTADALRGTLPLGTTQQALTLRDFETALRQYLRYQCRISQLASQTALLTFDMETVSQAPQIAAQALLHFLNITAHDHGEAELDREEEGLLEDSRDSSRRVRDDELVQQKASIQAYATSLLTWVQSKYPGTNLYEHFNSVLQQELQQSNSFNSCQSLWIEPAMSSFNQILAKSLAPICSESEPCHHERDVCEHAGTNIPCRMAYPVVEPVPLKKLSLLQGRRRRTQQMTEQLARPAKKVDKARKKINLRAWGKIL
jgi:hypothetical protein